MTLENVTQDNMIITTEERSLPQSEMRGQNNLSQDLSFANQNQGVHSS